MIKWRKNGFLEARSDAQPDVPGFQVEPGLVYPIEVLLARFIDPHEEVAVVPINLGFAST